MVKNPERYSMEKIIQRCKITPLLCISLLLVAAGLWEAVLGWEQLAGWMPSRHVFYPSTGSFYNPGPYCGFLGVIVPVALYQVLNKDNVITYWSGLVYLILAIGLMPSLMGRTGWIAAVAGAVIVAIGSGRIKRPTPKVAICAVLSAVAAGILLILLKPASALGRLFLWRIGLSAACIQPFTGVGWSRVGGALGDAQESFFAAHPDSVFVDVAGSPEYAFNEFLQIGIAFGIPAMILFSTMLAGAVICLWKGRQYGLCGGVASFGIVCFSSYPLQFPEYIALFALLLAGALFAIRIKSVALKPVLCLSLAVGAFIVCRLQIRHFERVQDWSRQRYLTQYRLYDRAIHLLDSLAGDYGAEPKFLFDYGKALRESGRLTESNVILTKGLNVSSDPMFLVLIGRNYEDCGYYEVAEKYYYRAINRLPSRMYPRFLLARMYAAPEVNDTAGFCKMHKSVSEMKPKVMSPAIRQMRQELELLRDSIEKSTESD